MGQSPLSRSDRGNCRAIDFPGPDEWAAAPGRTKGEDDRKTIQMNSFNFSNRAKSVEELTNVREIEQMLASMALVATCKYSDEMLTVLNPQVGDRRPGDILFHPSPSPRKAESPVTEAPSGGPSSPVPPIVRA